MSILVCRTQARTPSSVLETLLRQLNLILIMPTFIITEARFISSVCLICMTVWNWVTVHVYLQLTAWIKWIITWPTLPCDRCTCSLTRSTQPLWISTKQSHSSPISQWLTFKSSTLTTGKPLVHNHPTKPFIFNVGLQTQLGTLSPSTRSLTSSTRQWKSFPSKLF